MKNIHILPTDKPSQLFHYIERPDKFFLDLKRERIPVSTVNHKNSYITSNEEIKEGDWIIFKGEDGRDRLMRIEEYCWTTDERKIYKMAGGGLTGQDMSKKIILTTDQDLIKDGVQEIPDEFLEWFVKNTSCETIKVNHYGTCCGNSFISQCINCEKYKAVYKIIIPKEEIICESMTDSKAFKLIFGDMQDAQEENHNYLPGFIQQFDPEEGELNNKDWSAVDFLKWLELNKFKIIK